MEQEQLVLPCNFDVPYSLEGPLQVLPAIMLHNSCSVHEAKQRSKYVSSSSACAPNALLHHHTGRKPVENGHSALPLQTPTTLSFKSPFPSRDSSSYKHMDIFSGTACPYSSVGSFTVLRVPHPCHFGALQAQWAPESVLH